MKIRLNNIGIIKDSTIELNGLTVITGSNNSGKTTVGKALYSILDAVSNINEKAKIDREYYIYKQLENIRDLFDILRFLRFERTHKKVDSLFDSYPALGELCNSYYEDEFPKGDSEKYAHQLEKEIESLSLSEIKNRIKNNPEALLLNRYMRDEKTNNDTSFDVYFNKQKEEALKILKEMFVFLEKDSELIDYSRENINRTLNIEFSGQIQPIKDTLTESKIDLWEADSKYFSFAIKNNTVVNNGVPVYYKSPYKNVYIVDNPFILDSISKFIPNRRIIYENGESLLNPNRIKVHEHKLIKLLKNDNRMSVFEQTVVNSSLKQIEQLIDIIIPGSFDLSQNNKYYIFNGTKLNISNLATGSKFFSIIKMLLQKGVLNSNTMLILDEPESHLHPEWQNRFAEIIVVLVKEMKVNVLLTTHSSNFMLAIDAYMRKYGISNVTNFYKTKLLDDGFVEYNCVNDDMNIIYQDFLKHLSEVKEIRNKYIPEDGEDE